MVRLDPERPASEVVPPSHGAAAANSPSEPPETFDRNDAITRDAARRSEATGGDPASSTGDLLSSTYDLATVRDQIRRRLAGARHRLLLNESATLTQELGSIGAERGQIRVQHGSVIPRATGNAASAPRATQRAAQRLSIVVAPRLANGDLVLAVRYSRALRRWGLELPGIDDWDEDEGWAGPAQQSLAACGVTTNAKMSILGALHLEPRESARSLLVIFAENCRLEPASATIEAESPVGVVVAAPSVVATLACNGVIECARTLAALQLLRARVAGT